MRPIPLSFQHGERHCMPSPSTSLFDRSPFRTNTRRVASCSIIIARSSSSKVTTCCGSSFSAMYHLTTSCRPCRDSPSLISPFTSLPRLSTVNCSAHHLSLHIADIYIQNRYGPTRGSFLDRATSLKVFINVAIKAITSSSSYDRPQVRHLVG